MITENDRTHAGIPAEFPGIDINNEDNRPTIELLDDTVEERVLMAAKETGISTRGTDMGVTTVVDLIDDNNSDSNNESETPSLVDPDLSDEEDSDDDDDDNADGDGDIINHGSVSENANSGRH